MEYLKNDFDMDSAELISTLDETPLWSAPFGMALLDKIIMKRGMNVLDIGSGTGFPAIEIAQRLGSGSRIYCIDPWKTAFERASKKMKIYGVSNINLINGKAENLPFDDDFFDLIVSNNGLNNVDDLNLALKECARTGKNGAQLVTAANLPETMEEFYVVFKAVLEEYGINDESVNEHIRAKRKPAAEIIQLLEGNGFKVNHTGFGSFAMRFLDGTAMLNHYFIRLAFMPPWKKLAPENLLIPIFEETEKRLNESAIAKGELSLTIPFVCIDTELRK